MDQEIKSRGDNSPSELRVMCVIPGDDHGVSMSFSRNQASSVSALGVDVQSFFLRTRTSPFVIWKELRRLRGELRDFAPDIVHAHYGTMTLPLARQLPRIHR